MGAWYPHPFICWLFWGVSVTGILAPFLPFPGHPLDSLYFRTRRLDMTPRVGWRTDASGSVIVFGLQAREADGIVFFGL
jgi:hypothetical protein